jgi:hypothetical protein
MIATALASAALALAGPAPATLQGDLDAAAAHWQQSAPAGCSTMALSYAQLPNRILGEATVADTGQSQPCVMTIRPGLTRRLRCMTVVHEYGHWLGLHHSRSDLSPMFPVVDRGPVVPECERP